MNDDLIFNMISMTVKTQFEQRAEAFRKKPDGPNWKDLEEGMWAVQGLQDREYVLSMRDVGIGHWTAKIAQHHKEKFNSIEIKV